MMKWLKKLFHKHNYVCKEYSAFGYYDYVIWDQCAECGHQVTIWEQ